MQKNVEKRAPGQPKPPSDPNTPEIRELARFSGAYLHEIVRRVDEYTQFYPTATDRHDLVRTISLKASERPQIDLALDVLDRLSILGIKRAEVGIRVRTFIVREQITSPGGIFYKPIWNGERPKQEPEPQAQLFHNMDTTIEETESRKMLKTCFMQASVTQINDELDKVVNNMVL